MKKILTVALKDISVVFRDRMALLLMLISPLALTLVIVFAFGGTGGGTTLSNIEVMIVNHDRGSAEGELSSDGTTAPEGLGANGGMEFGTILIEAFQSDELSDLVQPTVLDDEAEARRMVDTDQAAAAVIIPENFSESILPSGLVSGEFGVLEGRPESEVLIYANPSRPIGAGVIRSIVESILSDLNSSTISGQVIISSLIEDGLIDVSGFQNEDFQKLGETVGRSAVEGTTDQDLIILKRTISQENQASAEGFNYLQYMAPSMAVLYLMFNMANAGRSILTERDHGTLPRMLVSPTSRAVVIGGKMLGAFLIGLIQMIVLIVAGSLLFQLDWGPAVPVTLMTVALVAAASGWGMAIASVVRTPGQANALGSAVNLTFAALAGNFVPRMAYPEWLQSLGLITPNGLGIEGYTRLITGGNWADVFPLVAGLFAMAFVLFGAAIIGFRRQYA